MPATARALVWLLLAGLALGATQAEQPPKGGPASAAAAGAPEAVSFETRDGFVLHADLLRAPESTAPVAILLHQFNADRASWAPLAPALLHAGFTVVALDQRGQGASKTRRTPAGTELVDVRALAARDRAAVGPLVRAGVGDVQAATRFLAGRGLAIDRIVLVGASYGCSVALLAAAEMPEVRALALLSPGTRYFDVEVLELATRFAGRLQLVAAEDDAASAASVREIAQRRGRGGEQLLFASGGHGVALFSAHAELAERIASGLAASALGEPPRR